MRITAVKMEAEQMNADMNKYLEKAEVLIEALPYIQRFNRRIVVVKYGGSAMVDEELKKHVIQDVTLLKLVGFKPIIVHGGGKEINKETLLGEDCDYMFYNCPKLTTVNLASFDYSRLSSSVSMFEDCPDLVSCEVPCEMRTISTSTFKVVVFSDMVVYSGIAFMLR